FKSWQAWAGHGQVAGDDVFRVTLRLDPPERDADSWRLAYLLQATDDPSLLVPAPLIWREKGATFNYLDRRFEQPQERLLMALGYAARLFPPIDASLRKAAPDHAVLTTDEAFAFLKEAVPLLGQSGFGVLLPAWYSGRGARLQARGHVRARSSQPNERSRLSLDTLVSFNWELTLGGQPLDRAEFERLVALKSPLVQVRGQWVVLDPEQLQRAFAFFEQRDGELELGDALRLALGGDGAAAPEGIKVERVEAEGWLRDLLRDLTDAQQLEVLDPPASLHGELRPYQLRGYSWMAFLRQYGLGACLADDMGLGKCFSADTLISINGIPRAAEDLWAAYAGEEQFDGEGFWATPTDRLLVDSMDEETGRIVLAPIRRLYRQPIKEQMRTIRLEDGSSITVTRRHQLMTNRGWTNELHAGDYVCVPARMIWNAPPADPDLVTFLASQIAEGYEQQGRASLTITQKDGERLEQLLQTVHRIAERYDLKINTPVVRTFAQKVPVLQVNSRAYRHFLGTLGYTWGRLSREKSIPDVIMQAGLDSVRLFLRNFFEAEGCAVLGMRSVEISTASPVLIQQLAVLLRRLGIWMRISAKQKCATNGTRTFRTYYVGVIGGNSARRFKQEIGFLSERKQQKLEEICGSAGNTNVEGIPASDIVADAVNTTRLPLRHFGMHNPVYINGSQQFSRSSLERVLAGVEHILSGGAERDYRLLPRSKWTEQTLEAYACLDHQHLSATRQQVHRLLGQEVFYCRIVAVDEVEYEGWVYDFEVEKHHNFVANNVLCHNTIQTISLLLHERERLGA
ncbi:MAG TPA: SNF2 helicase-associated domain-containing protein, partial [Herpetosiphonaceae bacterium]|nr:SNF2 helicase-associated domain-containing protein [Herpetosiphonaceae bacterium]